MEPLKASMIGLDDREAAIAVQQLNGLLANLWVFKLKLYNIHWNVMGESFFDIHKQSEQMYTYLLEELDVAAERVRQLGGLPLATMYDALRTATLKEMPSAEIEGVPAAKVLLQDIHKLTHQLRAMTTVVPGKYYGTVVDDLLAFLEKKHWMLHSYVHTR